jgi:hypothetical protein
MVNKLNDIRGQEQLIEEKVGDLEALDMVSWQGLWWYSSDVKAVTVLMSDVVRRILSFKTTLWTT